MRHPDYEPKLQSRTRTTLKDNVKANKPNQTTWRFPDVREEVKPVGPATEANTSSLVPTPIVYPPDHDADDWCTCEVCDDGEDDFNW